MISQISARLTRSASAKLARIYTAQPCCSSFFHSHPDLLHMLNSTSTLAPSLSLCSTHHTTSNCQSKRSLSANSDQAQAEKPSSGERPHMYQLEHVQKRLEFTVPLMFKMRLDYTFFRKDVVLDDQIFQCVKTGLPVVMDHLGWISVLGQCAFVHTEVITLSISPLIDDGTVRLRWRILYLHWAQMLNFRNFNLHYREKNLKWFDGYSVFHVDGEGLVYKWTIQKTMPDDSLTIIKKAKNAQFVKRVGAGVLDSANCATEQRHFRQFRENNQKEKNEFIKQ